MSTLFRFFFSARAGDMDSVARDFSPLGFLRAWRERIVFGSLGTTVVSNLYIVLVLCSLP